MQSKSKSKLKPKSAPASNGNLKESPWDGASLLGKYSLAFMLPMFARSRKNGLGLDDISAPPRVDQSRTLGVRLQHNYNQELLRCRHKPSFLRALWKTFGRELMLISLTDLVANCFAFPMQTIALGWLIRDTGIYLNFASPTAAIVATPLDVNATVAPSPTTTTTIATIATEPLLTADEAYWRIINDAVLLLMFATFAVVCSHPFFFQVNHIGMKCRIASCYMIYKKSLRLSQSAMSATTVGQMVNLLSNDVNRFDQVTMLIPYTIEAPAQAVIIIFILSVFYLGFYPTLASLVVIVLYVAVQTAMGRGFSVFRSRTAKRTDERVRLMNEIILAMKIIKMYAWEKPFKQLVHDARKREIATIAISSVLKCINHTLFFVSSKIIVFVALITYVALGNSLRAEIVFVSMGLADLMRVSLTLFFPNAIAFCAESVVSCQRIGDFLMLPEKKIHTSRYKVDSPADGGSALVMDKVYAFWETATSAATMMDYDDEYDHRTKDAIIRNLSLTIKQRDLVLIVGRVGSGKSSVLMSMLGELPVASGRLEINGRISYASQEPWIFSGTVRENVLFGKPLNIDRYKEVLRVCSLERDIEILVDGDSTIVGERGVSLSGGQKARVNLARALYHEADIYLLDDPLSAVDAPVAKHIFNESLRTFLRKKTVLLATHQLQFLPFASKVLVLNRDFPAAYGTLEEVVQSEAFVKVNYGREAFKEATATTTTANSKSPAASETEEANGRRSTKDLSQASTNLSQSVKSIAPLSLTKKKETSGTGNERREGREVLTSVSADRDTYWFYARNATGVKMFVWFVVTNFAAQGFFQYTDYYLSLWTDSVQRKAATGGDFVPISFMDSLTSGQISSIYAGLIAVCFATAFCRAATYFVATLRASVNIHNKMFESVVHAPMNFFDFSPIGILLNRLSRDIGFVDETLPRATIEIISIFIQITGIMITSMLINWWNIFAAAFLLSVSLWLRNKCASTIKRLKQIEGVTRSPIFSHLSTTLSGLSTIRAFKVQEEFLRLFDRQQDTHSSVWFSFICSSRWLAVSMDWLCIGFICSVVTLLLLFSLDAQNASLVGLLISQALFLPGPFQWAVRQMVEIESQMTSVQRIKEFTELSSEQEVFGINQAAAESYQNNSTWSSAKPRQPKGSFEMLATRGRPRAAHQKPIQRPAKVEGGEIKFCNLSLSYFPDEPPVLKELNFTIKPREKVGIVGRTGAGKSSIVSVLFRLYDFEGCVEIDGRDTKSMSLGELRRSMSIIPQDPILFGATIRKNLDPFAEHSDMELWAALEAVQLKPLFLRLEQGLDFVISEGGANFSVGQRQLICLARAIVRRNKILVLDEATANVDPETDVFIQRTISEQFADCTVLTIAHRLITIVDSDRVLVLDRGEVREFASPYELLQTAETTSLFAQMVASSAQQAPRLRKLIERAHKRRLGGAAAAFDER